jgi:hypothetical protein
MTTRQHSKPHDNHVVDAVVTCEATPICVGPTHVVASRIGEGLMATVGFKPLSARQVEATHSRHKNPDRL